MCFICVQVCDYVKENGTSGEEEEEEDMYYDEHGHPLDHQQVDEFGHRTKRQATGEREEGGVGAEVGEIYKKKSIFWTKKNQISYTTSSLTQNGMSTVIWETG